MVKSKYFVNEGSTQYEFSCLNSFATLYSHLSPATFRRTESQRFLDYYSVSKHYDTLHRIKLNQGRRRSKGGRYNRIRKLESLSPGITFTPIKITALPKKLVTVHFPISVVNIPYLIAQIDESFYLIDLETRTCALTPLSTNSALFLGITFGGLLWRQPTYLKYSLFTESGNFSEKGWLSYNPVQGSLMILNNMNWIIDNFCNREDSGLVSLDLVYGSKYIVSLKGNKLRIWARSDAFESTKDLGKL